MFSTGRSIISPATAINLLFQFHLEKGRREFCFFDCNLIEKLASVCAEESWVLILAEMDGDTTKG